MGYVTFYYSDKFCIYRNSWGEEIGFGLNVSFLYYFCIFSFINKVLTFYQKKKTLGEKNEDMMGMKGF